MKNYKEQAKELKRLSVQLQQEGKNEIGMQVYMSAMSILELDALLEAIRKELLDILGGDKQC